MSTLDVLAQARRAYDTATRNWHEHRRIGGIVRLDPTIPEDSDEIAKGCRYKTPTPAGATVLGVWQKCKAELDAAAANRQRELGDETCPQCPEKEPIALGGDEDRRLPLEHDDEAAVGDRAPGVLV